VRTTSPNYHENTVIGCEVLELTKTNG